MTVLSKLKGLYDSVQSLLVQKAEVDFSHLPRHIGIIMDGNGRWAKRHGLDRRAGHAAGAETLRRLAEYCDNIGIGILTVYAFSTENWKRPKAEVDALMDLLYEYLSDAENKLAGKNTRIKVIGDVSALSRKIQQRIAEVEAMTAKKTGMLLNIAINYGGRDEIVRAARLAAQDAVDGRVSPKDIDEAYINGKLYTKGLPDPDLIIRPSGELRLSNFLLWQAAYSEFWFSNVCWPDFTPKHLLLAIGQYQKRSRRFGGL